jgi:hypothetical protein
MNNPYQKHIIKLQGKEFITFKGLLAIAHDQGLQSIVTEMISLDKDTVEVE